MKIFAGIVFFLSVFYSCSSPPEKNKPADFFLVNKTNDSIYVSFDACFDSMPADTGGVNKFPQQHFSIIPVSDKKHFYTDSVYFFMAAFESETGSMPHIICNSKRKRSRLDSAERINGIKWPVSLISETEFEREVCDCISVNKINDSIAHLNFKISSSVDFYLGPANVPSAYFKNFTVTYKDSITKQTKGKYFENFGQVRMAFETFNNSDSALFIP